MRYCVYYYFHGDKIIYIGKTNNIRRRVEEHKEESHFKWYLENNKITYDKLDIKYQVLNSKLEMDAAEKILINAYKPVLNISCKNEFSNLVGCEIADPYRVYEDEYGDSLNYYGVEVSSMIDLLEAIKTTVDYFEKIDRSDKRRVAYDYYGLHCLTCSEQGDGWSNIKITKSRGRSGCVEFKIPLGDCKRLIPFWKHFYNMTRKTHIYYYGDKYMEKFPKYDIDWVAFQKDLTIEPLDSYINEEVNSYNITTMFLAETKIGCVL